MLIVTERVMNFLDKSEKGLGVRGKGLSVFLGCDESFPGKSSSALSYTSRMVSRQEE
jgi:hypothetical protein